MIYRFENQKSTPELLDMLLLSEVKLKHKLP